MVRRAYLSLLAAAIVLSNTCVLVEGQQDISHHTIQFVNVDKDVKLEVLDWGGTGRPLVFLAGLGNTAHVFDAFAPKLTDKYHVYGITRRGFGDSSKPAPEIVNYAADRLGDDVLAVLDALKLDHPILIGHSIAGEELSSIGSRHPEKVAGLVYLDAVNGYSFCSPSLGDWVLDMIDIKKKIDALESGATFDKQFGKDMLATTTSLEKNLRSVVEEGDLMPPYTPHAPSPVSVAIRFGQQKYTAISAPILAIAACPHNFDRMFKNNPNAEAAMIAHDKAACSARLDAFASAEPKARVVRLPNADHFLFESNGGEVIKAIREFLATLP